MSSESEKETIEKKPKDSKPSDDITSEKPAPDKKPPATKPPVAKKPSPAKEEPELPAFEKGIADKIIENFGEKATVSFVKPDRVGIKVGRDSVHDVAEFARDVLNYDHVDSVSGVDYPADKEIEVVYHLSSYTDPTLSRQILELATRAQREENPIPGNDATKLPSLRDIFYSVEFHEREVFEMLGVYFEGHPDNRRLLLPEDWADLPPLRKDFRNKGR
jgi:NADH-quinone oxidoreductase subunit C